MNILRKLSFLSLVAPTLLSATPLSAAGCCGVTMMKHDSDGSPVAQSTADYPLTTCVVSGDPLEGGDMGAPVDYVYKEEGKPDRLVRLCCKSCIKKFNKEPAKYLKMIDDAAAAKATAPAQAPSGHSGHQH